MIEVRKAKIEDALSIVNININSWKDTYEGIFPDSFLNSLGENIDESVEKCKNKINEYVVAIMDDKVVGFARIGPNKKEYSDEYAEVYALYIDNEYRHKGIGTELIKYCFCYLKEKYIFCLISTLQQNSSNEFYKKIGGQLIDTCRFKLLDKDYIENLYLFELNN